VTLGRQLFIGLSIIFALLVLGIESIFVQNARNYLQQQLDAHAQETATSLALSLGQGMKSPDAALAETVINPVFDRGHFASIRLIGVDGRALVTRELGSVADEGPAALRRLMPFDAPTGEALVSSGWRQLGRVVVVVHPRFAYGQLWHTALETLAWLAVLYVLALLAMRRFLGGILRPLHNIEQAALAIGRREFGEVKLAAGTRELQRVGAAMNDLSMKLRDAIAEESGRADRMYQQAFEDHLTGALNRRGLIQRVQSLLSEATEISSGAFAFVSMTGLEEVNRSLGAVKGDELVQQLGEVVREPSAGDPPIVGRWQGASFAILLPNRGLGEAGDWGNAVCARFSALMREQSVPAEVSVVAGLVHFDAQHPSWFDLERQAGQALAEAIQRGEGACIVRRMTHGAAESRTAEEWRQHIEAALALRGLILYAQRVFSLPSREVMHSEITSRLLEPDGSAVAAVSFVPAASRHHLLPLIDRNLLDRLWELLAADIALPHSIAVNISAQSLADMGFRAALQERLRRSPVIAGRIVFEVGGYAAVHHLDLTEAFAAEVRAAGARFALDGFELSGASLRVAHRLLPEYVKLTENYSRGIASDGALRFLVDSLVRIVRPLEIKLIASNVEDPEVLDQLAAIGFDGFQGYAGDRPSPIQPPGTAG
jgi:EAL domain-containing protein (putative c-di-GMP-specific phosphodiesterase class I)/GGDEF domain-containing protein